MPDATIVSAPPCADEPDRPRRSSSQPHGATRTRSRARSETVKLRRGIVLVLLTLVVPGTAQLAVGNRTVGRIALRVWAGTVLVLAAFVVTALISKTAALRVLTYGPVLALAQILLVLLAIGWAGLLVDAWRLARPPELARRHRAGFAAVALGLALVVATGGVAAAKVVSTQRDVLGTIFAGGGSGTAQHGRINILLLGGDAGPDRVGLRPDSITVASVDAVTGRTVLFGLPRNMEDVPFPSSSPMHQAFPNGFTCADHACMLNAVYTWASGHRELYPGVRDPGAQATQEAVEQITGLKINYYALIDLAGFSDLIDAVGGIRLDIGKKVPIGGGTYPIIGWIQPGKNVLLDGYHALWFARSREGSSDFERMARQKCVMRAMLDQLDPVTVATKFNKIAKAGKEVVATNVPTTDLAHLIELAQLAKAKPITSLSFVPPLVYPGNPKFDVVHALVANAIAASQAKDLPSPAATSKPPQHKQQGDKQQHATQQPASPASTSLTSSTSSARAHSSASASATPDPEGQDLAAVCSVA